jgi:hypothetical protein
MKILRKMIIVLVVILITSVIWVGTNIYLSYNSAELRGELLGSENIYEFLSKGMLDEVKITVSEKEDLEIEGFTVDLLEPIEPYFSKIAFEKIVEKIEKDLIVSPLEFHNLQNDAVMRSFEIEED